MKPDIPVSDVAQSIRLRTPVGSDARGAKGLKLSLESVLGGAVVLHCEGQVLSGRDVHALTGLISEVLPSAGWMVVNLAGVQALDSGALGELVLTHMWAEAAGYGLSLASPSAAVLGLFESANLVSILDVHESVNAAIAATHRGEARPA